MTTANEGRATVGDGAQRGEARARQRRIFRPLAWLGGGLLAVALLGAGSAWLVLRASLPRLDGDARVAGLTAPVTVARDALGVPAIRGSSRADVARATGFLHAQDRFFQMDLMRRRAAGELAELVGAVAVKWDRAVRIHRFRAVARAVVDRAGPDEREILRAYAEGVNAGLAALSAQPFEYLLLRVRPQPWSGEDSVLVLLSMFIELHDPDARHESTLGVMNDTLPAALVAFLAPIGTSWDAPLIGAPPPAPPIPGPEIADLRQARATAATTPVAAGDEPPDAVGSNNWALAGSRTAHGGAMVANDMHLGIAVPNTWYRASLAWPAGDGAAETRVTGVTLPGTPAVVVGSNSHVAWGFTNSYGDFADLVVIEQEEGRVDTYLTPAGQRRFEHTVETMHVKGGRDEQVEIVSTVWGPVVDTDHLGRRRALRWTAHDPDAVGFAMLRLEGARTLEDALDAANASGIPPQNFVCADEKGRIGWTIAGRIPRRVGFDGSLPASWRDGSRRWDGYLAPGEVPRIVDPPAAALWTANARTLEGRGLAVLGDDGYALGARARQIRDDLAPLEHAGERDMLAVQLDDRALFLERWRDLLLRALTPETLARHPRRAEARRLVEAWGAHAAIDSAGYRIVRTFRITLSDQVLAALTAPCRQADSHFSTRELRQSEDAVWRLLTERPANLLAARFSTWDEQILSGLDAALEVIAKGGAPLAPHTWGERNTASIRHPLSAALPGLGRLLDMVAEPLPGDGNMPRVQGPDFGASERMAVSPGHEEQGYLHMPCGASGHPLSPFYRAGHESWAHGEPLPFLPGPPTHTLTLRP